MLSEDEKFPIKKLPCMSDIKKVLCVFLMYRYVYVASIVESYL
jgi:hypothetical protein